jgi:hypothetical protein
MMKIRRNVMYLVGVLALTAGVSVTTALPAAAYSPGTSVAYKPTYNVDEGGWNYHCSYAHWRSGAKVVWHCDLHEVYLDDLGWHDDIIIKHSGSWTPGPTGHSTPTYLRRLTIGDGELCTVASALSVDGGSGTVRKCNA